MTLEADQSAEMFSAEADTESFLYCQYIISGKPLSRGENAEQGGVPGQEKGFENALCGLLAP